MISKAILCVQHFCSFGAMLCIVNLLIKTDSTVTCVPCMLEHVCYEPFSLKIADLEDNLCSLVQFYVLSEIHLSKTRFKQTNEKLKQNVYVRMSWEPVYKISYPYLHKQLRKIARFTYRFFKPWCESIFTRKRNLSNNLLSISHTVWGY